MSHPVGFARGASAHSEKGRRRDCNQGNQREPKGQCDVEMPGFGIMRRERFYHGSHGAREPDIRLLAQGEF